MPAFSSGELESELASVPAFSACELGKSSSCELESVPAFSSCELEWVPAFSSCEPEWVPAFSACELEKSSSCEPEWVLAFSACELEKSSSGGLEKSLCDDDPAMTELCTKMSSFCGLETTFCDGLAPCAGSGPCAG